MKITSKAYTIQGPVGEIEAVLDLPETVNNEGFVAVNCHPHSLHGGTMTNKVVHTVSRSIAGLGIPSLRFNFRGVGKSSGEYDEGKGEQEDLLAVVQWIQREYPGAELLLSGFSFGSFVSAFAANKIKPSMLLSVAPPVKRFDFDGFERPACEWNVIMGTQDELVEFQDVENWIGSFERPPYLLAMSEASHFFHGRLIELREHVERLVSEHINNN